MKQQKISQLILELDSLSLGDIETIKKIVNNIGYKLKRKTTGMERAEIN